MNDRELLELAAKAAGIGPLDFDYAEREGHGLYFGPRLPTPTGVMMAAMHCYWNPLTDDGDALRLAHKLGFDVDMCACWIQYEGPNEMQCIEFGSTLVELRRAIVRAAAEIGRSMP